MALLAPSVRDLFNWLPAILGFSFKNYRPEQEQELASLEKDWALGIESEDLPAPDEDGAILIPYSLVAQFQKVVRASRLGSGENFRKSHVLATRKDPTRCSNSWLS